MRQRGTTNTTYRTRVTTARVPHLHREALLRPQKNLSEDVSGDSEEGPEGSAGGVLWVLSGSAVMGFFWVVGFFRGAGFSWGLVYQQALTRTHPS